MTGHIKQPQIKTMRRSGILLHITSLPGPGGIGSLGPEAYAFADALKKSGMSLWQVLPCGPVGYGESPYQSPSAFAGNPLMISEEQLVLDGILSSTSFEEAFDENYVNYSRVRIIKEAMLRRAYKESGKKLAAEVERFIAEQFWLPDFALFMALKERYGGIKWSEWPDRDVRFHRKAALNNARRELREEIEYHSFVQYLFYRQWDAFRAYCHKEGILLLGDMPIYVAEDSADTWTEPCVFQLDSERIPQRVAGVPPDFFSEDGQLWGNPLYRWQYLRWIRRYDWWVRRMRGMQQLYDMVRVDHFIGFANYWSVPYGAPNARGGKWVKGPGSALFHKLNHELPELRIVAEDLGEINDRVRKLLVDTGYPGMRILSYGFGEGENNPHHPNNLTKNCILYTGTHDNEPCLSYLQHASLEELSRIKACYPFADFESGVRAMVEGCFESICDTCIIPMQDILILGEEARMNLPGTVGGNWTWRMKPNVFTQEIIDWLNMLNVKTRRIVQNDECKATAFANRNPIMGRSAPGME